MPCVCQGRATTPSLGFRLSIACGPVVSPSRPSNQMTVQTFQCIRFGSAAGLALPLLTTLAIHLARSALPASGAKAPLGGRVRPDFLNLPFWGAVVIKHYVRGGWVRFVNHRCHLRGSRSRSQAEFEMLLTLRSLGFDVPRPLAWAERGRIWVHTWLIMEERPNAKTLAELAGTDELRARKLLPQISEVVARLISHQIHHVDFHPGNVLIDAEDRICLIDFDKTARVPISTSELAERYRRRWQRAVAKHALPTWLGDEFQIA